MQADLRSFWNRFPTGVEVAVASTASDKLLGVRDGFHRYLHDALGGSTPVVVVPHNESQDLGGLAFTDTTTVGMAQQRARALRESLGDAYHFYVGSEGGLHSIELQGEMHFFVHNWTVIIGITGEALGASGSVEVPARFVSGPEGQEVPVAIPGTRRRGGMISSLTGGLETRRSAVAAATFHALSTLFYGVLGGRPK
jgi:non-canonical (house-cleaning) NTP pyrophosphatase